ncbi:MAG: TIGR04282 family arsenosugar biosynthesis glycosyltransferase [Nonlabens sp.]|uniref:TIGR04282 family arsenosugar biosynthesis glycosyltransferase n=1 Tax=Nonlabens sp. TaxID=1888209 RepID=UPI003EF1B7C5
MIKKRSQTAILLFAQSAQVDTTSKSLVNVDVMNVLNARILKTVQASGLDYYHFTEKEQRGNSFASRFTNAVQDVFDKGYKSIISLGNDTPLLTVDLIHAAKTALQNGKAVHGKSADGGLYLIGLNREQFQPQSFENLPWQSQRLTSSFHDYLKDLGSEIDVLKSLQDIDSMDDLRQFLAGKDARVELIGMLLNTLSRKQNSHHYSKQQNIKVTLLQPANKGSPQSLAA